MKKSKLVNVLLISMLSISLIACDAMKNTNNTERGTAIGVAGGAVIGGILGNNIGDGGNSALGAIVGAVVGGASGAYIGNRMDEQAKQIQEEIPGAEVVRVGEGIAVTFDENSGVYFATNQAQINADSKSSLSKLAEILKQYPKTNIVVEGHTDSTGNETYNMDLSKRRSMSVTDFLMKNGIDSSRLITKWFGEEQPKHTNETAEGRAKNRRVELAIVANEELKEEAKEQAN
ncbi:OmpA family protein [Psychroflexus planctonicus]|uniref:Membrane protein n=1 Tax=Psychroflexus planctonicus TaxID=1526575 RepID=A0ABQ1SDQ4_9FLAO|nr:OmpA family protein [Psychroflexus planctonicus]GGE28528.1 membrane protein [Psychroflexus planctonicus]